MFLLPPLQVSALLNASPCPSFLIGLAGPWITILGAVFTTHVIAQRLTGYEWHGIRGPQDDTPIFTAARRLYALRLCIADLRTHYSEFQPPHYDARRNARTQTLHPRFFPSITSYTASNDEQIWFQYVRPLEPGPACMVFLAKRCGTNEDIVVKFACVYGPDAHKWMADAHFAPKLEACQDLGKDKGYGDLKIIVMDFVQGRTFFDRYGPTAPIPGDVIEAVDRARDRLRQGRFILPDLRRPNLMWVEEDRDHPLRIVDFDWACKEGDGARYGFRLSEELKQKSRANDYDEISVEHEHNLYRNL
ncbi:hypothetical protein ONZ45_g16799 [Pleurotus djamor]|nr:hypothetical protein ONZ45_g16799 [Pleurotus djamor]